MKLLFLHLEGKYKWKDPYVYKWAGKPRTINIYKGEPILQGLSVEYSSYQTIKKELIEINNKYIQNNLSSDNLKNVLTYCF